VYSNVTSNVYIFCSSLYNQICTSKKESTEKVCHFPVKTYFLLNNFKLYFSAYFHGHGVSKKLILVQVADSKLYTFKDYYKVNRI